jgi:hypothetical protein
MKNTAQKPRGPLTHRILIGFFTIVLSLWRIGCSSS